MKTTLVSAILALLPVAAVATVAMEPQQATQPLHDQAPAKAPAHRQLFTVKYVLRLAPADGALPQVAIDPAAPQIVPPAAGGVPASLLGAVHQNPNALICYGWGCEGDER